LEDDLSPDDRAFIAASRVRQTAIADEQKKVQAARFADLLIISQDEMQFAANFPQFREFGEQGLPVLLNELDQTLPADVKDDARENLAKRQVNAAAALVKMNHPEKVWPLLKHGPDPRARSYLIHRLGPVGADPKILIEHLDHEPDISIRRALILSLGEFGEQELPPGERAKLTKRLTDLYTTADDPGLHAAAEWVLRTWNEEKLLRSLNQKWAKDDAQRLRKLSGKADSPRWYVNSQGQTMVVIPGPVTFLMGSPPTEADHQNDERQHKRSIGRTFAIAAKPVTAAEYGQFKRADEPPKEDDLLKPATNVSWHNAAAYCNWLSEREGIPEEQRCYEIKDGEVTKLRANYLSRAGYRLPTEAEMEYATRAGAVTSRCYGETEELLPKYAWYRANSGDHTWPVGWKKPNDLGLFDVHGNAWCWCQDKRGDYPEATEDQAVEDKEDDLNLTSEDSRVLRGGSFDDPASNVRSSYRVSNVPTYRYSNNGFRSARTLPLVPFTPLPPPP
jgi:formylglycine-generating enzyme required for sulfatase activity